MSAPSSSRPASREVRIAERFERANDDYGSILGQGTGRPYRRGLCRAHASARERKEFWGYAPDETLSNEELITEGYAGIRPAPGYPAQPDHTEKDTLFELLDARKNIGVELTESKAMWPGSSVSGL